MLDLAQTDHRREPGSSSAIRLRPLRGGLRGGGFEDMRRRVPDTTKIDELIGLGADDDRSTTS